MVLKVVGPTSSGRRKIVNPFANVPVKEKPGTSFALVKCVKNTCGRVAFK